MPECIEWQDDGTASGAPYSPRFGDRYRAEFGGISQARDVFLAGCGLPQAWGGSHQWTVLETGFGLGLNFLVTWQAWKADPERPGMLHFVSTEAFPASAEDVLRSASAHPELMPFAEALQAQLWGLLPGFHRLVFEDGHVLLTLCIGDTKAMLKQQHFEADSVYLDGFSPAKNPDIWDIHTFKAVARCCRRGTRIATWTIARSVRDALAQAGFVAQKVPGVAPKRDNLQGEYNPPWEPKKSASNRAPAARQAADCIVIGGGLAGAAVASSLARRGWKVTVLDAADQPAQGASRLPAGLFAPHVSPDDSSLSQLSRSGVRATLLQAEARLQTGRDWARTGVLERGLEGSVRKLPETWQTDLSAAANAWSQVVAPEQLAQCACPDGDPALLHASAGWIKPASLVNAWLKAPGIVWHGGAKVERLAAAGNRWQALDGSGKLLAEAGLVVLAAAFDSQQLAAGIGGADALALQPIRGQVSWGLDTSATLPPLPVNGLGSLVPSVPLESGSMWIYGATFERDSLARDIREDDHTANLAKLEKLLPAAAAQLATEFNSGKVSGWAGIRCATINRLPVVARLTATAEGAEIWACTGMGSRGLTFSSLCAELLAASLHGEPLPVESRLAAAMAPAAGKPLKTVRRLS